jgi:FKBP-type peptidyl-prolyl cis-trans isomerase FkpA
MPAFVDPGGPLNRFLAIFGFTALIVSSAACGGGSDPGTLPDNTGGITTLQVEDLVVGTGATAAAGDTLNVNYVGTLLNGQTFESGAYSFRLGAGAVIPGWDQGLVGMKVGGRRRLTIPPALAYGASGNGPIPPNSTIRFQVDLVSIVGK